MYDYSLNSAHAVNEKYKREEAAKQVQLAKEQKKDAYDAEMKSLATEALKVAKQNQRTTNKTFWVAVVSGIIGLITLIFK
jgi:hypothetical protein